VVDRPTALFQQEVEQAITRSWTYLFSVQWPDGSWVDHVSSSALATPIVLCALYYADRQSFATNLLRGCVWLRETQNEDGGWGDAVVDASTFNATALSLAALKLIDPEGSALTIKRALDYIDTRGGFAAVANPKVCTMSAGCLRLLALAGLYPWKKVSRIPIEFILLPKRVWRPLSFLLPNIFSWGLIHDCKVTTGLPRRWLSQFVKPKVLKWIESCGGVDGSWQDSPMITGIVSLALILNKVPATQLAPSLSYLLANQRADGSWAAAKDLEVSVTAAILCALGEVDLLNHPRLEATREWLLASYHNEPFTPVDYPGGWWSWALPSGWPDVDDTAGAIIALRRLGLPASHPYIQRGCDSLCKMQNRNGSWNTFVKEAHSLADKPCPAVTARAVLALYDCREAPERARYLSAIDHALGYFQQVQRSDGALYAHWFVLGFSTALVLDTYSTLNRANELVARKCRAWLLAHQRADGSWAGDTEQSGTVEETAWALGALAVPGVDAPDEALDLGAAWLIQQQHSEGNWSPSAVCRYALSGRYSSDHIANGFALHALGRYHRLRTQRT
jgi:squalene-hopene/tetraprenyl-beta-curcumene cyclase